LRVARGAILTPSSGPARRHEQFGFNVLVLIGVLPMFAQCFQYMTDIPPLYLLSKIWPFLTLPTALWAMKSLPIPNKPLHITLLFWLLVVTPVISTVQLGNTFADAMTTTVKVWSFTYVFSAAGVIVLLRVSAETITRVLIGLGLATFIIMSLLWVLVPASAYGGGDADTKLFMLDVERGFRIYMPMFFGVLLIFYLNRSAWIRFAWWKVLGIVIGFTLLLMIYKQRNAIASVALAVVVGAVFSMKRWRWAAISVLGAAACVGAVAFLTRSQTAELKSELGASLAVRQISVATAWGYLYANPERWLFGVGGTTRLGDVTLGKLFNNPMFFLADIGWLGVLFEYGAIGVALMVTVYVTGLVSALGWSRPDDAMSQALADYIVYLLASSMVYSAVFTPGELMSAMALSFCLALACGRVRGSDRVTPGGGRIVGMLPGTRQGPEPSGWRRPYGGPRAKAAGRGAVSRRAER
jgi:hypothetical protein